MKIKILGSGGGESFPAPFCTCKHCEMVRKAGGKSIRTLSQTFINDDLLIDFPADTAIHCAQNGINLGQIQNILITHAHSDHYMPLIANERGGCGAHNMKYQTLYFYGPKNLEHIYDELVSVYGINQEVRSNIAFVPLEPRKRTRIGRYDVTAIRAKHAPHLESVNYIIDDGKSKLLYLLDSGYPEEETLRYLQKTYDKFDVVVMDATMGVGCWEYHMNFAENKRLKQELTARGLTDTHTQFVITHLTHNNAETHEAVESIFSGTGIHVAFDGYEINVME